MKMYKSWEGFRGDSTLNPLDYGSRRSSKCKRLKLGEHATCGE